MKIRKQSTTRHFSALIGPLSKINFFMVKFSSSRKDREEIRSCAVEFSNSRKDQEEIRSCAVEFSNNDNENT